MSVRAYRVNKIDHEGRESFNLWHDKELMDFLDKEDIYTTLTADGTGLTELSVEALERAIKELDLVEDVKAALQKDIAVAKKNNDDYIQYYCF